MNLKKICHRINCGYSNTRLLSIYILSIPLILFSSCSGENSDNKERKEGGTTSMDVERTPAENKYLGIEVCELIPDELVAQTLGGTVLKPARRSETAGIKGCTYEIDPEGRDNYEICMVWFNPPSYFPSSEDLLETDRGLGQESSSEKLEGYGDEAFVIHNKSEEQSIIHVLIKEKVYLSVAVEHYEDAKKLTELILLRLKEI